LPDVVSENLLYLACAFVTKISPWLMKIQSFAQVEAVAEVPISKRSEDPDPSGYREAPARPNAQVSIHPLSVFGSRVTSGERRTCRAIICARVCKRFEYFQIFSNVSHQFSNIFKRFAPLFKRFRIFSNTTCAFDAKQPVRIYPLITPSAAQFHRPSYW